MKQITINCVLRDEFDVFDVYGMVTALFTGTQINQLKFF